MINKKSGIEKRKILLPHPHKKSRNAERGDQEVIEEHAKDLFRICFERIGIHSGALAMAHSQIEGNDPLRFFVTKDGLIIINPVITSSRQKYTHHEGCMSFPNEKDVLVSRFNLIDVEYISGRVGCTVDLSNKVAKNNVSGLEAAIFQHEIEHFDVNLIF